MKRFWALFLCVSLLLSGCALTDFVGENSALGMLLGRLREDDYVSYEDMVYERPDLQEHDRILAESCEIARTGTSIEEVEEAIYEYYDIYDWFYTNYFLAYIEYNRDMYSDYWWEEYAFCEEHITRADAGLEELYMALAQSPIRNVLEREEYFGKGFFDSYEGEATWDEGLLDLMEREAGILEEYYTLSQEADSLEYYSPEYFDAYAEPLCRVLIDLVKVRQEMAEYLGYDTYAQFAYDFYYYRDYTPEEALAYMEAIKTELSPLYCRIQGTDAWDGGYGYCRETEMFQYVQEAAQAMGGRIQSAFDLMDQAKLYDITYSDSKFPTSFELYLDSYYEPYVFLCPSGYDYDKLTFAHEFGHFAADHAAWGSYAGTDVMEFFSQGMEYLSLCYASDTEALTRYKLADCLDTYVEQSAYAAFEQRLYELPAWELTVDGVFELYEETCREFGVDFELQGWDPRDLVATPHFYTDPLYIISYVVSNDAAFQVYQLELAEAGTGKAKYQMHLDTECSYFLEFLEETGLESPFASGRVARVAQTLEALLGLD